MKLTKSQEDAKRLARAQEIADACREGDGALWMETMQAPSRNFTDAKKVKKDRREIARALDPKAE